MKRFSVTVVIEVPEDHVSTAVTDTMTVAELVRIAERGLQDGLCDSRVRMMVPAQAKDPMIRWVLPR